MSSMESLEDLMQDELKDIYDAEKQLTKALPKLAKKATNEELRDALEQHLQETEGHVERLEQIFEQLEMPARGKRCQGMKHLIDEGTAMISDAEEEATRDAVMIAAVQKTEHYEIASYGTLRTWANVLGKDDIASLLEETLDEEKAADEKLTSIAESFVNEQAAQQGGTEEEEERAPSRGRQSATRAASRLVAADRSRSPSRSRSRS
ncbi:MAG TPA: ferritin-like domain-containing protein [Vicinamibacterales bacterium]|nr:ferritin-like domain-containing protein [Vicinamibacterales bacterium]